MAYKTKIQVKVGGLAQVKKLEETLTRVNTVQAEINKRATSKIVDIGRVNAETKALTGLNRELEKNIALQSRTSRGGGRSGSGGGGGRPGGGGGSGVNRAESAALGVGFPLLFGGGAGQVLGGLAGSFVGSGFGGQILGSAIGGQIEDAIGRTAELGRALESLDVSALAESTLLVNAELREAIQNSIELGESQKAVEAVAKATLLQTGLFPENISDATNAATLLSNVWDELVGSVSGLVSIVAIPLVSALTAVLNIVNVVVKGLNTVIGFLGITVKRAVELAKQIPIVGDAIQLIEDRTKGVNEAEEERLFSLRQTGKELEKELALDNELLAIEQRRSAGTSAAAKLNNAELDRERSLRELTAATDKEILLLREKFGPLNTDALKAEFEKQESLIRQKALNEEIRIDKKIQLDQERAGQLALKELEKERKKIAKEAQEMRVTDLKVQQAGIQTQLTQIDNEAKILQLRDQAGASAIQLEQARYNAQLSSLQLEESRLKRQLDGLIKANKGFVQQRELINAIAKNQVEQAKIQNKIAKLEIDQGIVRARLARQQIDLEVQRIRLQIQMNRLKAQEIEDATRRAAALSQVSAIEKQTMGVVKEMVRSGDQQLRNAIEIGKQQKIVADNLLRGKLESIEAERVEARRAVNARQLARATGQAADQAARLNSNMSRGSSGSTLPSGMPKTQTVSTSLKIDKDVYEEVMARFKRSPARNPSQVTNALDKAQQQKNQYQKKLARLAKIREKEASFYEPVDPNKPFGATRLKPSMTRANSSQSPAVNITTGPVMEFDSNKYVSMADFEKSLASVARSQATSSRSYAGRKYTGVYS